MVRECVNEVPNASLGVRKWVREVRREVVYMLRVRDIVERNRGGGAGEAFDNERNWLAGRQSIGRSNS